MCSLREMMSKLSSRIQLRHKLVIIICLSLSIYTLISSETLSLLIGFNRNYNTINNNNNNYMNERKRGIRTNDEKGNLLFYHLPNLSDYNILLYYKQLPNNGKHCYISGTDWNQSHSLNDCLCIEGYFGTDCGIPAIVFNSQLRHFKDNVIKRMSKPKRVVLSVILFPTHDSHSFISFIKNSFNLISDFIDLFSIIEIKLIENNINIENSHQKSDNNSQRMKSITRIDMNNKLSEDSFNGSHYDNNYNKNRYSMDNSFDLKDLFFKRELKQYSDMVLFDSIVVSSEQLIAMTANEMQSLQMYALSKLWTTTIKSVTEFRPNDILIYMSSNSLPLKEVVMFLKHYEGFPEPIKFVSYLPKHYINRNNSLFNVNELSNSVIFNNNNLFNIGLTFEYLSLLCRYDFMLFKKNNCINDEIHIKKFINTYWPIKLWTIGNYSHKSSAIYSCTQCFTSFV